MTPQPRLVPLGSWDSERTWATFEEDTFHQWESGVELQKSQDDLDRYDELIEASQPDVVIETGTRRGGSALWFAERVAKVITIDMEPGAGTDARRLVDSRLERISWLSGHDSLDIQLAAMVQRELKAGQRVMVSLDSDHHQAHVSGEIALWSAFVTPGCYLAVEDACFDMWPAERARVGGYRIPEVGGPLGAIRCSQGLLLGRGFWRDTNLEGRTPVSHSPVGWWRHDD